MHVLRSRVRLRADPARVWDFLRRPPNLAALTPPEMGLEMPADAPREMREGTLLAFRVRVPLLGRVAWVSELKHVRAGRGFVDEQRVGPFAFWWHEHEIAPAADGGTEVRDVVRYRLPGGPLGRLADRLFVRRNLQRTFAWREERMRELLDGAAPAADQAEPSPKGA